MPRIIRSAGELGPGKPVLIYGAGDRGAELERGLRAAGLPCRGFLDSFSEGEHCGLPVYRYEDAPADLLWACRIVIASFMHGAIAKRLSMDGVSDFFVLADQGEDPYGVPLALDVEEALDLLAHMSISLGNQDRPIPPKGVRHTCGDLDRALWVGVDGLKFCCFMPDLLFCQPVEQLVPNMESLRQGIYGRIDQGRETCCSRCMFMGQSDARAESYQIQQINLGHNNRCNFKCSYCTTRKNMFPGSDGLVQRLMNGFAEADMLHEDLSFAWAGEGEPVLDPDFEDILGLLLKKGSKGLIFTNASVHSSLLEEGLRQGRLRIVTSLDAGTPKTFERMHGVDAFDRVVANLRRYRAQCGPEDISLKYILTADNANQGETGRFVELCGSLGIRKVMISSDYSLAANPYPELTAQFRQEAEEAGLEVSLTPWSA